MAGALSGYRVLEFGDHPAVAVLGMLLADQGADVIKVESPDGDPLRGTPVFSVWNRGKKSVVAAHDDSDLVGSLVAGADAVIEGSHSSKDPYGIDGDFVRDTRSDIIRPVVAGFWRRTPPRCYTWDGPADFRLPPECTPTGARTPPRV